MSKQKICLAYYTMLGCLILTQVFYTLYQTSLLVAHGRREKDLENKQVRLLSQKQALQETLAINNSLLAFSESHDLSDYHAITQPILVEKSLSLAALN